MPLRHESLVAWQRADDLFIKLHRLTLQSFPSHEKFELGSQLRRAAYSVPAKSSKDLPDGIAERVYISSTSLSRRWLKLATASTPRSGLVISATRSATRSNWTFGECRRP